jgi:hypothetical protein
MDLARAGDFGHPCSVFRNSADAVGRPIFVGRDVGDNDDNQGD